ncbi:MAG: RHS repeat protein, partial [Candidatus Omnitrophica bacterium]|nr:RHS repeat protein [Candidatus Omnitrophota bacterium]
PTGSLSINGNAAATANPEVSLTLMGADSGSGLDQMSFSTDGGTNWTAWENFLAVKPLTLPTGDGTKEVRYRIRDKAGNVSVYTDEILLQTVTFSGTLSDLKFSSFTGGSVLLEPQPSAVELTLMKQWSYSIDGGAYSTPETYAPHKTIALSQSAGRHTLDIKFYDANNTVSPIYHEDFNLDALQAALALDSSALNRSLHALVREGLVRTDKSGNLESQYSRDLLAEQTSFNTPTAQVLLSADRAGLPSMSAEFDLKATTNAVLFETGIVWPGEKIAGKAVEGTAKFVVEDGFFKLKWNRVSEQSVDGAPVAVPTEDVVFAKPLPQAGKHYEIQFDYTLDGLQVFLDEGERSAATEPFLFIPGAEAGASLQVNTAAAGVKAVRIYGNTKKILTPGNQLHEMTYTRDAAGKLTEVNDKVLWSRMADTDLKNVVFQTHKTFDAAGRLSSWTNRNGEKTEWSYDASGRIISEKEPNGRLSQYGYTQSGSNLLITQTVQSTDGFGNTVNAVTKETWDSNGRRSQLELPTGKKMTLTYAGTSRDVSVLVEESPIAYTVSGQWDARGRNIELKDRTGSVERRVYQAIAEGAETLTINRSRPNGTDAQGNPIIYQTAQKLTVNRDGKPVEAIDVQGHTAKSIYDAQGDITRFDDGFGRVTTWEYTKDRFGGIRRVMETLSYTDDFGNSINARTLQDFDAFGNLTAKVEADGNAFIYQTEYYNFNHLPKKQTAFHYRGITSLDALWTLHNETPGSLVSIQEWNEAGDATATQGENSVRSFQQYLRDSKGNLIQQTEITEYEEKGQIIQSTEKKFLDLHGNTVKQVDAQGNEQRFVYDAFDQLLSSTSHLLSDANAEYDQTTLYQLSMDAAGRIVSRGMTENKKDGFGNGLQKMEVEELNRFGMTSFRVHADRQAEAVEYTYRADGSVASQSVFYYQNVLNLADLKTIHSSTPSKLKEVTSFGLLGEVIHRGTRDEKSVDFLYERNAAGAVVKLTTRTSWTAEDNRAIQTTEIDEWNSIGDRIRHVDAKGDETLYVYGALGSLKTTTQRVFYHNAQGSAKTYQTVSTLAETRAASGVLLTESETLQSVDAYEAAYQTQAIRQFDEYGNETASIDAQGKGVKHEYGFWPWGAIKEVRTYEYFGLNDLAALNARHISSPNLVERITTNFLGEEIESTDRQGLMTLTDISHNLSSGEVLRKAKTLKIAGEPDQVLIQNFDAAGRLLTSTDARGIKTTYSYAPTGDLLSQEEEGTGTHRIQIAYSQTRYSNGGERT